MDFKVDSRISESSIFLLDWPLSRLFLKNEQRIPWLMLIPRVSHSRELMDLSLASQQQLMIEMVKAGQIIQDCFNPDKVNMGALGNIVSQLHVHVLGRFASDPWWPQSVWQAEYQQQPLSEAMLAQWKLDLMPKLLGCFA